MKPRVKLGVDYLVYVVVRLLVCVVQALPIKTCAMLARPLARLLSDVLRVRRPVIEENLGYAFPELTPVEIGDLALRHWEHVLLMIFEMAHADRILHETNWRRYVRLHNMRPLVQRLLDTRPAVVLAGHFGNFEISAHLLGLYGFPTFAVARPLDNSFLNRYLNEFRSRYGQRILPKKGSAGEADARLAAGGVLAVLGDQAAGPKGCWVDFFDRPASTHKAIAVMSLMHEAPLIVTFARRLDRPLRFEVGLEAIADPRDGHPETAGVRELTAWYTNRLEAIIRRNPEQYWWVHRRWKDQRQARPAQRAA